MVAEGPSEENKDKTAESESQTDTCLSRLMGKDWNWRR